MLDLLSVVGLVIVRGESHHCGVVSKFHNGVGGVNGDAVHMPVFRIMGDDVRFLVLTFCGLLGRQSIIHEQSKVERLRLFI